MKIIWQFVVTKSIFEAIDAGDLQKIAELTSIFKFDAFKINSDLQLSPIQAALATMNLEIIHALLPSSMTLEQNIRLWLYAARVSNPEFIYDYFFKISLLCPAQNQTIKRDFLQQLLDNECWQALEWIFAQGIQVSFFPAIDFKPKQAVVLSLFALKYGMQEQLLKHLYTYLLDAPLNFSLNKPEEQGKTIPWYLAYQEKWQLLREIFRKNPHASLNIMPIDGEYKDASILWFCAQDDRWNLLYDLLCLRTMSPLNSFVLFKAPAHNEFSLIEWVLGRAPTEKKKEIIFHILVQLMLVNPSILSNTTNDLEPNLSQTTQHLFKMFTRAHKKNWISAEFIEEFTAYKNKINSLIRKGILSTPQSFKEKIAEVFCSCGMNVPLSLRNRDYDYFDIHLKEVLHSKIDFFKQPSKKRKAEDEIFQPNKKIKL